MHKPLLANRLGRWLAMAGFGLLAAPAAHAQLAGSKAIPGDYPTVAAAITTLNAQGVGAGGVTFNIAAGYTETFASPTAGAITATGTSANPIVFQKSGTGANPLITAGVGTASLDAIISLSGSDYVTLDGLSLAESAANTTTATQMEFGIALFRPSPTDGCQFNIIRNCVVTLNKANTATFGIYGAASTAALATSVAATAPSGANSNNKINGNTVSNAVSGMYLTASASTTAANYDLNNEIGVTAGNTVTNFGGVATSGWGIGVNMQNGAKIANNTVNSTGGTAGTSTLRGIYGNTGTSSNFDVTNNTITLAGGGTTTSIIGIDNGIGSTAASNTVNITGNTIQNSTYTTSTSGAFYGIQNTASAAVVNLTGNTISGNASSATSGAFMALRNTASAPTLNINTNIVTNNTLTGSGEYDVVYNSGTTSVAMAVNGNQFSSTAALAGTGSLFFLNNSISNTGTVSMQNNTFGNFTKSGVGGTVYGYYNNSSPTATQTISGNTISNITLTGATTFYGTFVNTSSSQTSTLANNTVSNIVGGTSTMYGLYIAYGTATSTVNTNTITGLSAAASVYGLYLGSSLLGGTTYANTISGLSATGASSTVYGLYTAVTSPNIYANKLYNLANSDAAGLVYGLYVNSGTTITAYNNLVGDLRAPASASLNAVVGLYINGGTTVNTYYNTLYVAAGSTAATFGTSGIYLGSTSTTLDARNNIVVNKSTAAGTGGYTAAFRRVSGTAGTVPANYATTSNNNLYYAGTPSATNLLYVEGTTTATNAQQTLAAYKAFLTNRDQSTVTEDVPFISTTGTAATFLHISPSVATQVESGGTPISGITTDFDNDARNASTPDIGADEGTFTLSDLTGPSISFTTLTNTGSTANRTLTATITDPSGISTSTAPRIFFRKGTSGAFTSALATSTSGSSYTFTIDAAALGGLVAADVVQYYVVAQDALGNVSSNPSGGTFTTLPTTVYQYTILSGLSGTYYVGTGTSPAPTRTYATLTAAANAYSTSGMTGPVSFLLLDNTYTAATGETFPVVFFNNPDASAANTLLIKPNTGATPVVTAAGSVLILASTRYVTIDGSNNANGTTRDLTLTNTTLTASTYSLGLLGQTGQAQANLFATVRNVNAIGGGVTANATIGIVLGGADNDNVTLQNNSVQGVTTGIQAFGTANASVGGLDNLVITGNVVGPATAAAGANINQYGIVVGSALSPVVSRNEVQNIVNPTATFAANMTGILLQDVQTGIVTRNTVHTLNYTGTSTAKLYGISTQISTSTFNTAATPSAIRFDNNLVYALNSTASSASWNTSGINNNGGYGDQYYYNTVYLSGQLSTGTAGSAAFSNGNGISATAAANIDVRNNIFSIVGGTGAATTPLYAHYTTLANYTASTLNYNDLYVTVTGTNGVARIGRINSADATTLADWRTATGQEANSLSVDPQFVQTTAIPYNLTPSNTALNNVGTPIGSVTVDYAGTTRGTVPDIGALEFTPLTNDLAPVALVAPATTNTCYGTAEPVTVSIRNAGTAALDFATSPATITVVVTLPGGTTTTLTTTLTSGTLASGTNQAVTLPGTLNMSTVGTYSFAITATVTGDGNTTNDLLAPAPTRTVLAPVAGTLAPAASAICVSGTATLTLTGAANGSIQYQSSTDNVTFTDIAGATSAAYTTPVLTATTYFRAQVRCNTGTATSNVSTITVNNPTVAATNTPLSICAGSTATLTASASTGASVRFFSAATGGTALTPVTAGSYTTPALTANTTYYAEAFTGGTENVGKTTSIQTDGGYAGSNTGLVFTATGPTTIQAATVYNATATAGSVSVELRDNAGTLIATAGPFALAAGSTSALVPTVLPLNLAVPAAGTYRLVTASTPTPPTLYRDFTGVTYPYTSPSGTVTITGGYIGGASTTYYFFYNIAVSNECVGSTARTAIQVNVTQPGTASFPAATASTCGTSAYSLAGTVGGSATTGTYTSSGTGTFSPNATTLNATYTPSAADVAAGTVTITLTSAVSGPCPAATATLTLSISPAPVATFSYPTATTYCAGSSSTVTPTLGAGATAGTFSSTTGLSIDPISGVIILSSSTAGTYTVTNTVAASGACAAATATTTVTIAPATSAAFAYATSTFCASGTNPTPSVTGTTGGTFSSTTGLSINATTGAINLSASTLGTYTVTYTVSGACGTSATASVTITAAPVATFSYPTATTYCAGSSSTVTPTLGTGASAGVFSSTTGLAINATTGVITLATSTAGTYTVTNTIAASGACSAATATTTVTITPAASAAFTYSATTFCVSGTTAPVATVTGTTGGTFTSTTGLTLNATTGAITLASSTPGTYTVTYTVSGTCGASSTRSVTITAAPVATFSYATSSACAGSATLLPATLGTGASAGTFTSTTGLTINATTGAVNPATSTAGTYTVTNSVAANGGCAAATSTATVTINALPATPTYTYIYPTPSTVLFTSSVAPAGTTYQWYLTMGTTTTAIAGATSQTYTANGATAPGSYTVRFISTATGCQSAASTPLTVTATAQPLAGSSLTLFPNPTATGKLTLQLSGYSKAVQLTVIDALGRVVLTQKVAAGQSQAQLDLSGSASGVYMLRATTEGGTDVRRIVRE